MSWLLHCTECKFLILVSPRGMRGADMGSGVEAAEMMERHVKDRHDLGWREYLTRLDKKERS